MDITTTGTLEWPITQVWELVSSFADLDAWHPEIERSEVQGMGVGATRKLHFADKTVVERLDERDDDQNTVVYSVVESTRPATIGVSGRIKLTEDSADQTAIVWITSLPPAAEGFAAELRQYYPRRIEHLREALKARFPRSDS
jgi:hypothetical protein